MKSTHLNEFKKFISRGNVIELAIGVVLGVAFNNVVNSFVEGILMPPISILTGGVDFSNKVIVLKPATELTSAITINYGAFINTILEFFIIAATMFIVVRYMNKLKAKEEKKDEAKQAQPSQEVILLQEIRDLLKK